MWKRRSKSVADIDSFIVLLNAACADDAMNATLEKILSLPDEQRMVLINRLVVDMRSKHAPEDFVAAIACLVDTPVAVKAYEVIFKCRR